MCFGAAFGYALNDYYDASSDRISRPDRPIPSGALTTRNVLLLSLACLAVSLLFTLALAPPLRLLVAGAGLLVWLYNAHIKHTGLPGNLVVSLLAGFTLVFGGLSAGQAKHTLFPALLAFLVHLPREILKDVQDVEGDSLRGGRGVAAVLGKPFAARFASLLLLVLVAVSFVPYATRYYGEFYLGLVVILDSLIVWSAASLWRDATEKRVRDAVRLLKFAMLLGLVAVAVGGL